MIGRQLVFVAIVLVSVVACVGVPAVSTAPSGSPVSDKPVAVIQQPGAGAVLGAGQNVAVSGQASDTIGVDRVTLTVDGVAVAGTPPGTPATLLPFSFNWIAVAGAHTLQVIAYRADGTASDPAIVQVTVGGAVSALPGTSGAVTAPPPGQVTAPPPERTRRPRRSRAPSIEPTLAPTTAPTATPTAAAPTDTPVAPTPTPSLVPTPDANGLAPDDSAVEPYLIELLPPTDACPAGPPAAAVGCYTEQISAPGGDIADQFYFVPLADASYKVQLTACTDVSGGTVFHGLDPSTTYGCGQSYNLQIGPAAPAQIPVTVKFNAVSGQMYNLYQLTIYHCAFFNCGTQ